MEVVVVGVLDVVLVKLYACKERIYRLCTNCF